MLSSGHTRREVGVDRGSGEIPGPWHRPARAALLALLLAAAAPLGARAADPAQQAPQPATPPMGEALRLEVEILPPAPEPTLTLSLKEALILGLQQNLDLQVERFGPPIAATDIQKEEGDFDTTMTSKITNPRKTVRDASQFFQNTDSVTETLTGSQEFAKKFSTGTVVSLVYESSDTRDPPASHSLQFGRFTSDATLKIAQSLLRNFGREINLAKIRIAERTTAQARTDLTKRVLDVAADVLNAYWDIYKSQQTLETRRESYSLSRTFLENKQQEVRLGILAPIELLDIQADLANKITDFHDALKTMQENSLRLKTLLNLPVEYEGRPVTIGLSDVPTFPDIPLDFPSTLDTALKNRPEYQKLKFLADQRRLELTFARSQTLPDLEFSASLGFNNLSDRNNISTRLPYDDHHPLQRMGYEIGLKFTYPLGNNAARADLQRRQLQLGQTLAELRQQELAIKKDLSNAFIAIESNKSVLRAAMNTLALQEKNVKAARQRLQFGTATIRELLDIQTAYIDARLKAINARVDHQKNIVNLFRAKGLVDPRLDVDILADYGKP